MTRAELLAKKSTLQELVRDSTRKIAAIDEVLTLFPDNKAQGTLPISGGIYEKYTGARAIIHYLRSIDGEYLTVAELSEALKSNGLKSDSPNFRTIISTTCERLVETGFVLKGEKAGLKAFAARTRGGDSS